MFPSENYFFQLLAYAEDHKQKRNIIKFINKSQLNTLKQISKKILNGEIPLNNVQYRGLERRKLFLRRLSKGKIRNTDLLRNFITVCYIVKISLKHYEKRPKISSRTCGKVGKNRRQYSRETSVSDISYSEECFSSDESHFPGDESEVESEKSERFRETTSDEKNSDVSFSHSGEEEQSN